jgi:ATP-dependent RNA helicase DeaD
MLFSEMMLPDEILKATQRMGFTELTEIQQKALPPMLKGADIIAKAPTGTGKTCAFGIPLLINTNTQNARTQALVLAPTRELAQQITQDLQNLAHYLSNINIACLYGGQPIEKQLARLKKAVHIIVATPGRLLDHIERKTVNLSEVTRVVLDEADEMLDMGFYKDVRKILDSLKNKKQLGMFSATISREVMDIGWLYQRDAEEITVNAQENSKPQITQYSIASSGRSKLANLAQIIISGEYVRVMVFCNTKYTTASLANQLARLNFNVDCLHGDLSQKERNQIMANFKKGELNVLICTDVAARGIDVEDVDAVINYDMPQSAEYYTHRIGRTGRAKRKGASYIFYMPDEEKKFKEMVRLTKSTILPVHFNGEEMVFD